MNSARDTGNTTLPDLKNNLLSEGSRPSQASSANLPASADLPATPQWPNPEASIGIPCCSLGAQQCWEVSGPALDISRTLLRHVKELFDQHSHYLHNVSILFSITFGLFMIGSNEHDANPTLVISSERELTRMRCVNIVRRSGVLTQYPGILLGSNSHSPTSLQQIRSCDALAAADKDFVFFSPPKTNDVCGRSIHVMGRSPSRDLCPTSISQKATMGGFLRLKTSEGGELYCGLTVATTFKDGCRLPTSNPFIDFAFDGDKERSGDNHVDGLTTVGPDPYPPPHVSQICHLVNVPHEDKTYMNSVKSMDKIGIGNQVGSSLDGQHPSLDWALVEIQHPYHEPANVTSVDWIMGEGQLYVEHVAPKIIEAVSVLVITSIGVRTGFLSASSIFYKSPYSASLEEVYVVRLDAKLESVHVGCWVINPEGGDLYGHIVATCPEARTAYLVPAHRVLSDIQEQFGGTVELAGRTRAASNRQQAPSLLGLNQTDEAIIRQFQISKASFAEMAVETELIYQALVVNPSNLKQYIKKRSPFSWHDISDKAKYESMIKLSSSSNPRTQPHWHQGKARQGNLLARWFIFRRFRLAGTSRQRSFGEVHAEDLDVMFAPRPASRMGSRPDYDGDSSTPII